MVDARGHGLSDKPEDGYTADDYAADFAGLIEALELGVGVGDGPLVGRGQCRRVDCQPPPFGARRCIARPALER